MFMFGVYQFIEAGYIGTDLVDREMLFTIAALADFFTLAAFAKALR